MVHSGGCKGGKVRVTDIAGSGCRQVRRSLAKRVGAVVAVRGTGTTANRDSMDEGSWFPGGSAVTTVTGLVGLNMRHRLGLCVDAHISSTVAGVAVSCSHRPHRIGMTHQRRREGRGAGMTSAALRSGREMSWRCWLTQGVGEDKAAVVTTRAVCPAGVVHGSGTERDEVLMATRTLGDACWNVRCWLA